LGGGGVGKRTDHEKNYLWGGDRLMRRMAGFYWTKAGTGDNRRSGTSDGGRGIPLTIPHLHRSTIGQKVPGKVEHRSAQ